MFDYLFAHNFFGEEAQYLQLSCIGEVEDCFLHTDLLVFGQTCSDRLWCADQRACAQVLGSAGKAGEIRVIGFLKRLCRLTGALLLTNITLQSGRAAENCSTPALVTSV